MYAAGIELSLLSLHAFLVLLGIAWYVKTGIVLSCKYRKVAPKPQWRGAAARGITPTVVRQGAGPVVGNLIPFYRAGANLLWPPAASPRTLAPHYRVVG